MSDISIPGVPGSSRFETDKMIEDLMEVERAGLDRMEGELEEYETEKDAWQSVNRNLSRVRDSSRTLYGFENPFNERISVSSDESVLTASVSREASFENAEIAVRKLAGRDRFLSRPLDEDYDVPPGKYTFSVGDRDISFTFRGGDLRGFAETINRRSRELINARVVRNSSTSQVLLLESTKEGAANTLQFSDDALTFAENAGILKPSDSAARQFSMEQVSFRRSAGQGGTNGIRFEGGKAVLPPQAEATLPITPPVISRDGLKLEIAYQVEVFAYEYMSPEEPPGPSTPERGGISFQGIEVYSESSRVLSPEWSPPPPPERNDDMNVFFIRGTGSAAGTPFPLPAIADSGGLQTIFVDLDDYVDTIDAVEMKNANTHRQITVESVRIFDPDARGDYAPMNPVETASDAIILFEGIEITRDTNNIDDLLPGVVLNLQKASDDPVQLSVEPDKKAVKDAIIEFVGYYDELISELNILTGRSEDIIDEITYLSDEDRQRAYERLGLLQGDITVMQLKSRLQTILMNPYATSLGRELSLLDQIGISTNAVGSRSGTVNRSRLRGYLEINEDALDQALDTKLSAVKELFGQDTDNDLVVDSGVAYALDTYLRPYVETAGLVSNRIDTIDGRISRTSTRIETEQEKLVQKEQDYRRQFATMEGALNSLEQSSQQIDNFNRNNSSD